MAKSKTVHKRIEELASPNVKLRRKAAHELGWIGDAQAVEPLCLALKDEDPHVRNAAANALGRLRDPLAFEPLREALSDARPGLRQAAAWAVGQIGKEHPESAGPAVMQILLGAQKSKPNARHNYVAALLDMQQAVVAPLCIEYNSHRNGAAQDCARQAFATMQYQLKRDVRRLLLAEESLTPAQVWTVLEMLDAERPAGFFMARRFPPARLFCEVVAAYTDELNPVKRGAVRVLDYLSLGRASQFHDDQASAQLLRMASGDDTPDSGEMLLRGAQAAQNFPSPSAPVSIVGRMWQSILSKLRRRISR